MLHHDICGTQTAFVEDAVCHVVGKGHEVTPVSNRQHGRNTVKSNNDIDGIPAVRKVLTGSEL